MKNIVSFFSLCFIFILFIVNPVNAQNIEPALRKSKPNIAQRPSFYPQNVSKMKRSSNILTRRSISNLDKKTPLANIDTLNYPLAGTYTYYYIPGGGGYVTGNNEYEDLAKANYFEIDQAISLNGILFDFFLAIGGNPTIQIVVWDNSGSNHYPGNIIATATINLDVIKNDISNDQMSYIPFDPPVTLTTSFYAGLVLPETPGDTVVLWSNTDGDTNPGIAWEQWNNNNWYPMNSNQSWKYDIAMAIFPVVDDEVTLTADFTANLTNIQMGQTINFQDLSAGNPAAWEWIFEGGEPATSSLQNPLVIYNEAGTFNVTLTIWKDTTNDSKTIPDYITVGGTQIEIDTLNFPLAGEYAVYIKNGYGFVTGNNAFGDQAKANFFQNNQNWFITGVLMEFAYTTGGNPNIELALWNNSGANGSPGAKIGSQNVPLNTIKNHINNQQLTYVAFNPPVSVSASFYAGFMLPTTAGDTLVIWSNTDGDTDPTTAWELWSNNEWHSFTGINTWNLNIALAVFPIVQNTLGIDENNMEDVIKVFPNPSNGFFSIVSEMFNDEPVILSIHRIDGTLINTRVLRNPELFSVDLRNEPAGIYFVTFETDSKCFIQKLVKR